MLATFKRSSLLLQSFHFAAKKGFTTADTGVEARTIKGDRSRNFIEVNGINVLTEKIVKKITVLGG